MISKLSAAITAVGAYVPETKLTNAFFEKKLGTTATTRNWNTVNKLVELAN